MRIGELSVRTGVSQRLLRYYEEQGLLSTQRDTNGYRVYDDDAVITVRQIRALLAAGLSTCVIRKLLPCARGEKPELDMCPEVVSTLREQLDALDERIDDLRQTRGALAAYVPTAG
ncbi:MULTISPECIES: MerR family transcriptional regulator [Amycolatopsis]|uniref:MerR family transcriptional regulator n=1 Tax=Amycolatopsis TaxID=1813 RepID=UPI000B8B8086|nr:MULTISPECIES: MerR family transcriptional regulator [Amycolatopsis]OXM69261.1 MerR family transcriptional regulator [Amycolatopsis sp. KNN50.9b]